MGLDFQNDDINKKWSLHHSSDLPTMLVLGMGNLWKFFNPGGGNLFKAHVMVFFLSFDQILPSK